MAREWHACRIQVLFQVDNLLLTRVNNISESDIEENLTISHGVSSYDQKSAFISQTEYISLRRDKFIKDFDPTELDAALRIYHKRIRTVIRPSSYLNESLFKTSAKQEVYSRASKRLRIEEPKDS